MNDPNGLIQWNGQVHLFYQYNPNGPFDGAKHWGHAVSDDLLHWKHWPIALAPSPGGPDGEGCWSGSAVDQAGVPTLVYTGIDPQVVCLATSHDGLVTWNKDPANPVIAGPPPEIGSRAGGDFRDPFVWRDSGAWQMVMGTKIEGLGGAILRFRSDDLRHWEYAGVLLQGNSAEREPFSTGTVWECPNFFQLDGQHILIFSVQSQTHGLLYPVYYAGEFQAGRFAPRMQRILVYGSSFYAPQVMRLNDGRTVMWGWLQEQRRQAATQAAGWAGAMSLPMALTWLPEGVLGIAPVEELKRLRRQHWHLENVDLALGVSSLLRDVQGDSLEIEATFEPTAGAEFGIRLRSSPDGAEQTRVVYRGRQGGRQTCLVVEREQSSMSTDVDREPQQAPLALDARGQVCLHIFLDRSVLEVFANGYTCLASRIYPARPDSLGLELFGGAGSTTIKSLDVWKIDSI